MTEESFSWLNKDFIQKIVQNQFSWRTNEFYVESFDVTRASGKGDNYLGTLLRVKAVIVRGEEKHEEYYIVKTSAGDGNVSEEISSQFGAYPKEKEVYGKLLPAFEAIWKDIGVDVTFGPKCFGVFEDPVDIIVLEDLKQGGYAIGNRCVGLDLNHALLAVEKAAQFHATSLIYLEKHGKFSEKFYDGFFCAKMYTDEWKQYYSSVYTSFVETMTTWPNFEKIVQSAKKWGDDIYLRGVEAVKINPGEFGCLVHGDMWLNNLMFKNSFDGKPDEIRLIDFQITSWSTPAQDLFYFITNSLMEDVLVEEFDTIIAHYQDSLEKNLKKLQYSGQIPSLREIQLEMLKRSMIGVCCAVEGMVTILMKQGDSLDIALMSSETEEAKEYRRKIYANPVFESAAKKYLIFLNKRGMLDLP